MDIWRKSRSRNSVSMDVNSWAATCFFDHGPFKVNTGKWEVGVRFGDPSSGPWSGIGFLINMGTSFHRLDFLPPCLKPTEWGEVVPHILSILKSLTHGDSQGAIGHEQTWGEWLVEFEKDPMHSLFASFSVHWVRRWGKVSPKGFQQGRRFPP